MIGRVTCAIGCLVLAATTCGAHQAATPAVIPTQQASGLLEPISSPEMDALATKIMERISAAKAMSLAVVGGGTPDYKVSELGVDLRDGLNDSLLKQAGRVHVFTGAGLRPGLRQLRVSEGVIYCNALADWIAKRAHTDAVVMLELKRVENRQAILTVQLFDERTKKVFDKKTKTVIPLANFEEQIIPLTELQVSLATREYRAPSKIPNVESLTNGTSMPTCTYCPAAQPSEESRRFSIEGTVYLAVTVLPDGSADDIRITRPLGHGLDGPAIDALREWKFKPALDGQKRAIAALVPIEMVFAYYPGSR